MPGGDGLPIVEICSGSLPCGACSRSYIYQGAAFGRTIIIRAATWGRSWTRRPYNPPAVLKSVDRRAKALGINRNRLIIRALEKAVHDRSGWSPEFMDRLQQVDPDRSGLVARRSRGSSDLPARHQRHRGVDEGNSLGRRSSGPHRTNEAACRAAGAFRSACAELPRPRRTLARARRASPTSTSTRCSTIKPRCARSTSMPTIPVKPSRQSRRRATRCWADKANRQSSIGNRQSVKNQKSQNRRTRITSTPSAAPGATRDARQRPPRLSAGAPLL